MRILLALAGKVEGAGPALAEIAAEHEVIVLHADDVGAGHALELALRNALPDRDVVSVLTQVVVSPERPGEPDAIAEVRSLRALLDAGALVICAAAERLPVSLDGHGALHEVEGAVDMDLIAALLARRLDADLLVMLSDGEAKPTAGLKLAAARRFVEATERTAAIGRLADAARVIHGKAGTQVLARAA